MARVLVVTLDPVGRLMAGPGIRALELSQLLAAKHNVVLAASPPLPESTLEHIRIVEARGSVLRLEAASVDFIILAPTGLALFPFLAQTNACLVIDLATPYPFERLESNKSMPLKARDQIFGSAIADYDRELLAGDFFLCASERQRHLYVGSLLALGRITPSLVATDRDLHDLIRLVPFGLPSEPPVHSARIMRGVIPGIAEDDPIILWGGGFWDWLDPQTLVRACAQALKEVPTLRLVFMGGRPLRPDDRRQQEIVAATERIAADFGLMGRNVFFVDSWVSYTDRQNYLLEATIGTILHRNHLETTFAYRTRVTDYIWAGLPVLITEGDSMSEVVSSEGLGVVVRHENVDDVAKAIVLLATDSVMRAQCRLNVMQAAERFRWSKAAIPLLELCDRAPNGMNQSRARGRRLEASRSGSGTVRSRTHVIRAWQILRTDGPRQFASWAHRNLRRRLG